MKARKKVRWLEGLMAGGMVLFFSQTAESQSFSDGKNLFQLQKSLRGLTTSGRLNASTFQPHLIGQTALSRQTGLPLSLVFLPPWSAEELPFFCRVEHGFAQKSRVPFKFRLGSVEYVDWLEGKGDWELLRQ